MTEFWDFWMNYSFKLSYLLIYRDYVMFIISSNLHSHHKTAMIAVHLSFFSYLCAQVILSPNNILLDIFVTGRWRSQTVCLTGEKQAASGV